jgi:hypothetical protein
LIFHFSIHGTGRSSLRDRLRFLAGAQFHTAVAAESPSH